MKRKTLVKLMAILLVGLLIVLGIMIGMKKGKSGDSQNNEVNKEEVNDQEETTPVLEDVFEYDEESEPIKSDRIDDETEDTSKEDSDFKGIVLPDDEF